VPGRSRFGNKASRFTMRLLCGMKLQDTQTGLRGIPVSLLPAFLQVEGDRFEYETNMLLEIRRQRIAYKELIIDTIYINENETSHFRPLRDGWRVYSLLLGYFLRFVCSSLLCAVADVLLFTLFLHTLFAGSDPDVAVLWATVLARVLSSILNFAINRRVVFRSERSVASTLWRYYALCVCQMLASALLVMALNVLPIAEPLIKCVVDGVLFLVSYRIQRRFVFGKR
jgi:dolichol-phosphate mannosyltransferase